MKKIIKLTESDLTRLVIQVIKEQSENPQSTLIKLLQDRNFVKDNSNEYRSVVYTDKYLPELSGPISYSKKYENPKLGASEVKIFLPKGKDFLVVQDNLDGGMKKYNFPSEMNRLISDLSRKSYWKNKYGNI
jgi:hypothetical protein